MQNVNATTVHNHQQCKQTALFTNGYNYTIYKCDKRTTSNFGDKKRATFTNAIIKWNNFTKIKALGHFMTKTINSERKLQKCSVVSSRSWQWVNCLTCSRFSMPHLWLAKPYLGPSSSKTVALNGSCSICQSNSVSSLLASSSSLCSSASASARQMFHTIMFTELQKHTHSHTVDDNAKYTF